MKKGFVRTLTITAAMVSMLSTGMTAFAAENYTVAAGDHLMKIAREKYGDKEKWNIIYEANKDQISDPTKIYPGQVIVIPDAAAEVSAVPAAAAEVPAAPAAVTPAAAEVPAAPAAVTPAAAEVPAAPAAVAPAAAEAPAVTAAPAKSTEVSNLPAVKTAKTLEDYASDPEIKKELEEAIGFYGDDSMKLGVSFQGNTMAVVVTLMDPSYAVEGMGTFLDQAMVQMESTIKSAVADLEKELGNPGNCVVIYSFQTADGKQLAQRAFTAK